MDPRFSASREDLYNLQMEVKQVQYAQSSHAERILRLEKRQADDSALKSVWNSPFPGVLGGTPQQGPVQAPHNDPFDDDDDLDEQGEQLLGSLHLGPTEEEPVRRGASRANSVRFDESALHGSSWGGQSNRHSGDFGPVRPSSGLMMERSLSHKSDGRHSSAGHSVHSHHSVASGRASSLGLDNNFAAGEDDSSSFDIPVPPASLYVLGTVPSIVRCWLTTNFSHGTLLYADVCTGSQRSTMDYSLVEELDLLESIQRDGDGVDRARLDVYLAEAVVTRPGNRSTPPGVAVPSMSVLFEINRAEQAVPTTNRKSIRAYIGSDALRAHSADVLFSQNTMVLYGNDRERLKVPFVRPEDEGTFRHICTMNMMPEKPKLNANAAPFVAGEPNSGNPGDATPDSSNTKHEDEDSRWRTSTLAADAEDLADTTRVSEHLEDSERRSRDTNDSEYDGKDESYASDASRRESSTGIHGSWRHGTNNGADGFPRESGSLSGYQPATRGSRNMKVLKPTKSGSTSARTGASYEPPPPPKSFVEGRRKSQASTGGEVGSNGLNRWDMKRVVSSSSSTNDTKSSPVGRESSRSSGSLPRSVNPVGVASAFSWMTPTSKPTKAPSAGAD